MRGCLENFILNDLKQEIQYFTKHLENVTVCMACESPRLAVGLEGPECNPVILILGLCESSCRLLICSSPCHLLVAKPLDKRRNQYKLKACDVCCPPTPSLNSLRFINFWMSNQAAERWVKRQSPLDVRIPLRMVFQKLGGADAMLKPMLIFYTLHV